MSNNTFNLIIDSALDKTYLILSNANSVIKERILSNQHHNRLVEEIGLFLKENKLSLHDLTYIGIGQGPGFYTSMRMGALVGMTLSYAQKIPLVGFCSLMGYIPENSFNGEFYSIFDAKSKGIYGLKGEKTENKITYAEKPLVLPIQEAQNLLKNQYIVTSCSDILCPYFSNCHFANFNSSHISQYVYQKFAKKEFLSHQDLELNYLIENP
jgi:tRNA threonylcarbamoyl adenosine modification protein YeaZ